MVTYSVLTVHAGIASSPSPASPPSTPPHRIPSRISRHGPLPSPSSSPEGWFRSGQPPRNPQKASQSPEGESKSAPGSTPPRPFCSLAGRAVVHLVAAEHRSCAGCHPGCWGERPLRGQHFSSAGNTPSPLRLPATRAPAGDLQGSTYVSQAVARI